jgi:hypothetical protein
LAKRPDQFREGVLSRHACRVEARVSKSAQTRSQDEPVSLCASLAVRSGAFQDALVREDATLFGAEQELPNHCTRRRCREEQPCLQLVLEISAERIHRLWSSSFTQKRLETLIDDVVQLPPTAGFDHPGSVE